jgi:hypothetical protein
MIACKGAFLRTRFTSKTVSAEMIARVGSIDKGHASVSTLCAKISKWYGDWRYQLKCVLRKLKKSYNAL